EGHHIILPKKKNLPVTPATQTFSPDSPYMPESPPQPVNGRVTDSLGNPVEGASVRLIPGNRGTSTYAGGMFTIAAVEPGSYTLEISSVGYLPARRSIIVSATVPSELGDIVLSMASSSLT